jgi:hypothetical protein
MTTYPLNCVRLTYPVQAYTPQARVVLALWSGTHGLRLPGLYSVYTFRRRLPAPGPLYDSLFTQPPPEGQPSRCARAARAPAPGPLHLEACAGAGCRSRVDCSLHAVALRKGAAPAHCAAVCGRGLRTRRRPARPSAHAVSIETRTAGTRPMPYRPLGMHAAYRAAGQPARWARWLRHWARPTAAAMHARLPPPPGSTGRRVAHHHSVA